MAVDLRGFSWAVYVRDDGVTTYAKQVDRNAIADPARGWTTTGAAGAALWPQRGEGRRVFGVSETTGRRGSTLVGNPAAPLWTGAATTFQIEASDGTIDTLTVTRRRGESFSVPR